MPILDEIKDVLWLFSTHERHPCQEDEAFAILKDFGDLVIDGLIWGLRQDDSDLKLTVLVLLQEHYTNAKRALPAVRALICDDQNRLILITAINTLHIMDDTSDDLLPLLQPRLKSNDDFERILSAANLWRICRSEDAYFVLRREAGREGSPMTEIARGYLNEAEV
jgi:hypothetical protein